MDRRGWIRFMIAGAIFAVEGRPFTASGRESLAPFLDILANRPLCERCLAINAGLPLPEVKDLVGRIGGVLVVGVSGACEECGREGRVYTLPRAPRATLR
jgi:hypothetical protein